MVGSGMLAWRCASCILFSIGACVVRLLRVCYRTCGSGLSRDSNQERKNNPRVKSIVRARTAGVSRWSVDSLGPPLSLSLSIYFIDLLLHSGLVVTCCLADVRPSESTLVPFALPVEVSSGSKLGPRPRRSSHSLAPRMRLLDILLGVIHYLCPSLGPDPRGQLTPCCPLPPDLGLLV